MLECEQKWRWTRDRIGHQVGQLGGALDDRTKISSTNGRVTRNTDVEEIVAWRQVIVVC